MLIKFKKQFVTKYTLQPLFIAKRLRYSVLVGREREWDDVEVLQQKKTQIEYTIRGRGERERERFCPTKHRTTPYDLLL